MEPSTDLLADLPLVAFDLETTGLGGPRDRIVEFGAVHFHLDGQVVGQFQQLVNPQRRIPRRTQLVHGISDAMVQEMPTVAATLPKFLEFLGTPAAILLAHNATFDVDFLRASMRSPHLQGFENPVVDTMLLAQRAIPGLQRYSLQRLVIALEIAKRVPHRALADAQLVMHLFRRLLSLRPELRTRGQLFALAPPVANYRAPGARRGNTSATGSWPRRYGSSRPLRCTWKAVAPGAV